jgi:fumarate reductase flavoprotein subunit
MVQFHPTGLLAGSHTRMTGTVLEEGLRGAGGHLLNGQHERFMHSYDSRGERATRDIVSRGIYSEMRAGRTSPNGGVYIKMSHLGPEKVRKQFKGMVERCADCGFDLAGGLVEVVPTAHYMMGGVVFEPDCRTALTGLFAAGEDTGGVHGANRLGGNGVANSTVFGGIAGESMARWVSAQGNWQTPDEDAIQASIAKAEHPFRQSGDGLETIREALFECMWKDVGIMRDGTGLLRARAALHELNSQLMSTGVADVDRAMNLQWHDWLNLKNLVAVSQVITEAAIARQNSRGAHFREDWPDAGDLSNSSFTTVRWSEEAICVAQEPVQFTRVRPGETILDQDEASTESAKA